MYNPNNFLSVLGTFWSTVFEHQDLLRHLINGVELRLSDAYFRFCEIMLGESIKDIPVFSKETWKNVVFKESEINVDVGEFIKYGDPDVLYGDDYLYGGKRTYTSTNFKVEFEDTGEFICNKVYNPSLLLTKNKDFSIRNNVLSFNVNPFDNPLVPIRNITDQAGEIVDREISLWIPNISINKEDIYKRYGTLINIYDKNSQSYKTLLNTIFGFMYNGPKIKIVKGFINAIFDFPIILDSTETVNYIVEESSIATVYTDKNTYVLDYPDDRSSVVQVGAVLGQYEPLYDIINILDDKTSPNWWINRKYFNIPEKLLDENYLGPCRVKPENVYLNNTIGETFQLNLEGSFTPELQTRLENYPVMIGMGQKIGETFKINTMDLIVKQIKDNIFAITLDPTKTNFSDFSEQLVDVLDKNIPAYLAYIILADIGTNSDEYNLNDEIEETVTPQLCKTPEDNYIGDIDWFDGYYGLPKIGVGFIIGTPGLLIGRPFESKTPWLQVISKGGCLV